MVEYLQLSFRQILHADLCWQQSLLSGRSDGATRRIWLRAVSPRFMPVLLYRLSHQCHRVGLRVFARFFSLINFLLFGIEIATNCSIGPGLFFPHTHGTVIGAVRIGRNAVIYQGVTIGAKSLDLTYDEIHRPVIGDNVLIGSGARVLGGISVGHNVRIGANAVLLMSVGDNVTVAGVPARVVDVRHEEV